MMGDPKELVAAKLRMAAIIWGALVAMIVVYWGIVIFLGRQQPQPVSMVENPKQIHLILLGLAVMIFLSAGAVRSVLLRSGPSGSDDHALAVALQRLIAVTAITGLMGESVALIGLVEFFLLRAEARFEVFLIIALGTLVIYMPRYGQWRRYLLERFPGLPLDLL